MEILSEEAARLLRELIDRYRSISYTDLARIAASESAGESIALVGESGERYTAEVLVLAEPDGHVRVMAHLDGGPNGTTFLGEDYFLVFPDGRTAKTL